MDNRALEHAKYWDLELPSQLSDNYIGGFFKVMFGWRYRIVHLDQRISSMTDWCLGVNKLAHTIYPNFINNLSKKGGDEAIEKLPVMSTIKPIWNDSKFHDDINKVAEEYEAVPIPKEILESIVQLET